MGPTPVASTWDATSVLTVHLVLLVGVPSVLVFAPLGGAGSPAQIIGLLMLGIWGYLQVQNPVSAPHPAQPVRAVFVAFVLCVAASFVLLTARPVTSEESSLAMLGFVGVLGWAGVLLMAHDGIGSLDRLEVYLRRLAAAGGLLALLGIAQFITGRVFVDPDWFPGLSLNAQQTLGNLNQRSGFNRAAGTAVHPIEFGAVLAMTLPIALTFGLFDRSRGVLARWWPVAALSLAVVTAVSRSGYVAVVVSLLVLAPSWTPAIRRWGLVVGAGFLGLVAVAIPGMLGTMVGLFTAIGSDSSANSRVDSYPIALEFIGRAPVLGRGFGTFSTSYRILDNAYLGLAIELGLVGLATFVVLVVVGFVTALSARRHLEDPLQRALAQALAASLSAGAVGLLFYDGLGFPMAAVLLFCILGLCGAIRRLAVRSELDAAA